MHKLLVAFAIAAALIGGASSTGQAAITFEYDNTCTGNCSSIGLNDGDPVSGSFSFNDAAVVAGATLGTADVLSFALDFGNVDITSATALAFFFSGTLNGAADAFSVFAVAASEGLDPNRGDTITARGVDLFFFASPLGQCGDGCLGAVSFGFGTAQGLGGTLVLQEVPEPGTLALFGTALAGAAFVRRRRRA